MTNKKPCHCEARTGALRKGTNLSKLDSRTLTPNFFNWAITFTALSLGISIG
jgi:hypothetical protein